MKKLTYLFILLLILILTFGCKTKTNVDTGENLIPPDKLENIIYDIHIADAIVASKIMKKSNQEQDSILYASIFIKHECSRKDFENTLMYYINYQFDSLNAIYERVLNRLNTEKGYTYK